MWGRITGSVLGGLLALGLATGSVAAGTFASATAEVGAAGELRVTATEVGIRDASAHFVATATATATYACRNRGGHIPRGHDAEPVFGVVYSPEVALTPDANGVATGTMVVPPLPGTSPCPPGLAPVLIAVRYERVAVADDNSGAGMAVPGAFTRQF